MIDATDPDETETIGQPEDILLWIYVALRAVWWGALLAVLAFAVEHAASADAPPVLNFSPGTIVAFPIGSAFNGDGWVAADGSCLSDAQYPALADAVREGDSWPYGRCDAEHFRAPDLQRTIAAPIGLPPLKDSPPNAVWYIRTK